MNKLTETQLKDAFRAGVKNLLLASIWKSIEGVVINQFPKNIDREKITGLQIAEQLGMSESQQSRCQNGETDAKVIFVAMSLLNMKAGDLDELPHIDFRAIAGYRQIIYRLRFSGKGQPKGCPKDPELIPKEVFLAIRKLYELRRINSDLKLDKNADDEWKKLAKNEFDGFPGGWYCLRENFVEWGAAVYTCMTKTPYKWAPGTLKLSYENHE